MNKEAAGSTFEVSVPLGRNHLPPDQIVTDSPSTQQLTSVGSNVVLLFVVFVTLKIGDRCCLYRGDFKMATFRKFYRRLVVRGGKTGNNARVLKRIISRSLTLFLQSDAKHRILVADDNSDMRDYLKFLLEDVCINAMTQLCTICSHRQQSIGKSI